jgi:hypothetical protein
MNNQQYGKLTSWLLAAWFVFALSASALHLYQTSPSTPPLALGMAVLGPVVVFLAWFRLSAGFRGFVFSLNPRILTMVHTWRVGGFVFLVLYTYGILPGLFALPAGWGDIAIGATASFVSLKLASRSHRLAFIVWQILGMFDLVMAISLGTMSQFINPNQVTTAPMTMLPLSLIPTFAVPLLFIFHFICITQARLWREPIQVHGGSPLPSTAA